MRCRRPVLKASASTITGCRSQHKAVGIGALAVGNVKYRTEAGLFDKMIESEKPLYLDFRAAYALAQKLAA